MPYDLNIFASSSGLGALGINLQALIIQLVTFVIVFLVLKRFAFKPILKVLQQRRELIENGVKLGEQMQKEKVELEDQVAAKLHQARTEADDIITTAQEEAKQLAQEAEETAKEKANKIVAAADAQIEQDTARARKKLEGELVGLISEATEAIIEEKVDAKKDAALIDKALRSRRTA
jgi:F-type H+-transporting ATPase subunit b